MKLFIDLTTRRFVKSAASSAALPTLVLKRRDVIPIEVVFVQRGAAVETPTGTVTKVALKNKFSDGNFLAVADSGTLNLYTTAVEDLFVGSTASADALLEVRYTRPGETTRTATLQIELQNSVILGDEGTPAAAIDYKATQPDAIAGTSNDKWMTPLRTFESIASWVAANLSWSSLAGKPSTFAPSSHTHPASQITDFAAAVSAVSPPVDWSSLTGKPSTFAPSSHTHPASDVTGLNAALGSLVGAINNTNAQVTELQTELDGKASAAHTHTSAQITDFASAVVAAAPPTTNASLLTSGTLADARLSSTVAASLAKADTALQSGTAISNIAGLQTALDGKQAAGSYAGFQPAPEYVADNISNVLVSDFDGLQNAYFVKSPGTLTYSYGEYQLVREGENFGGIAGSWLLYYWRSDAVAVSTTSATYPWQATWPGGIFVLKAPSVPRLVGAPLAATAAEGTSSYAARADHVHPLPTPAQIGAASLVSGKVPASQLPSYVDDVLEYATYASFPLPGETGKIYVATGTGKIYRWSGSAYVEISSSPGSTDSVPEGASNLYFTAARAVSALASTLASYATTTALNSAISGLASVYTTTTAVASQITAYGYQTAAQVSTAISSALASYATTASVSAAISALVTGVSSVAGKTGAVALVKADVGLGNCDNTSDANKPISTATQTALNGKAASVHTHAIADVTGLQTALDGKQAAGSYAGFQPAPEYAADSAAHAQVSGFDGQPTAIFSRGNADYYQGNEYAISRNGQYNGGVTGSWALEYQPSDAAGGIVAISTTATTYPWQATWTNGVTVVKAALPRIVGTALATNASEGTSAYAARADHVHPFPTAAQVGAAPAGSYVTLDGTGKISSTLLPSYVDDVIEVANFAALPKFAYTISGSTAASVNGEYVITNTLYNGYPTYTAASLGNTLRRRSSSGVQPVSRWEIVSSGNVQRLLANYASNTPTDTSWPSSTAVVYSENAGQVGKIYVVLDTGKCYRWSGSSYIEISQSLELQDLQLPDSLASVNFNNRTLPKTGSLNGKNKYSFNDGWNFEVVWTGTNWRAAYTYPTDEEGDITVEFNSTGNTAYPWQATGWTNGGGVTRVGTYDAALAPAPLGADAYSGVGAKAAREDHVHPLPTPAQIGAATTAQGAKADSALQSGAAISTISGLQTALDGKANTSHSHSAADITSGTIATARLGSGTPNSTTFLRGDQTYAAPLTGTGAVDKAILRASGTGGSTLQSSDIVIDDATISTSANVALANQHSGQTNSALVLTPKGTGAFILGPKPDGTATGGNARGVKSVDLQMSRTAANLIASGNNSVICGGVNNGSWSHTSAVCGGSGNINQNSSYQNAFIGCGTGNQTNGSSTVVCGGELNYAASNSNCVVAGRNNTSNAGSDSGIVCGYQNSITGVGWSFIGGGPRNSISSYSSAIVGGENNTASNSYSAILGGFRGLADRYGMQAHAGGRFAADGDAQRARFVLRCKTTTNSAVEMALDGATTYLSIPSGKIMSMTINISGVKSDGSAVAHYVRQYAVKNVAGTSSQVYAPVTIGSDNPAGTFISLSANDADDTLRIAVTGVLNETWRWVASVDAVEIGYGT